MWVRIKSERSLRKSQWLSFSTAHKGQEKLPANAKGDSTFSDTPKIFATFDDSAICSPDILRWPNDGKGHRVGKDAGRLTSAFISVDGWRVYANVLRANSLTNLYAYISFGKDSKKLWLYILGPWSRIDRLGSMCPLSLWPGSSWRECPDAS